MAVSAAAEKLQEEPAPRWERQKLEKLAALPLSEVAAENAVLFLPAPDHSLADSMQLLERCGFHYEASIVM